MKVAALAYAYGAPDGRARFKQSATDFAVSETLPFTPSGTGEHLYLHIRKTGCNTHWVAEQIAKTCGLRTLDVGYAGRKDRHAVCEQWFSCYLPGQTTVPTLDIEGVQLLAVTHHRQKLRKGDVAANRFVIRLRDVAGDIAPRLALVRDRGFPNYFGDQRFGQRNLDTADAMLRQGRRISRQRDIYLSAARGYLFNRYLSERLDAGDWDDIELSETGPLYGRSRDPQPGEEALCEQLQAWIAGLRRLKMRAGTRPLKVFPQAFTWQAEGDQWLLAFSLPAGSYATSLLREVAVLEEPTRNPVDDP